MGWEMGEWPAPARRGRWPPARAFLYLPRAPATGRYYGVRGYTPDMAHWNVTHAWTCTCHCTHAIASWIGLNSSWQLLQERSKGPLYRTCAALKSCRQYYSDLLLLARALKRVQPKNRTRMSRHGALLLPRRKSFAALGFISTVPATPTSKAPNFERAAAQAC